MFSKDFLPGLVFKGIVSYCAINNYVINLNCQRFHSSATSSSIERRTGYPVNNNNRYYRYRKPSSGQTKQLYDAFLVLDFESTCKEGFGALKLQEIIEFPCLWVDGTTLEVTSKFHRFVKPKHSTQLDPFCVSLTGITDDMLEKEQNFSSVLKDFLDWVDKQKAENRAEKIVFVTSGDWDLKIMLPLQCRLSNLPIPAAMARWINIKEAFCFSTGLYPNGINHMIKELNLTLQGRIHSGIDDCNNIANIVKTLAKRGYVFT